MRGGLLLGTLLGFGAVLAPTEARAEGESLDLELVRPAFSAESGLGLDHPRLYHGDLRVGLFTQYERDPLVLYEEGMEQGAVVHNRQALTLGLAHDLLQRVSLRAALPVSMHWGGEVESLAASGVGLGNPRLGGRVAVAAGEEGSFSVRGDLALPIGTADQWTAEERLRATTGLLAALGGDWFQVLVDLAVTTRQEVDTDADLAPGTDLFQGVGLRYRIWPDRWSLDLALLRRADLQYLWQARGENGVEALVGLRHRTAKGRQWQIGLGKGLNGGYGTSGIRVLLSATAVRHLRPEPPAPELPDMELTAFESELPPPPVEPPASRWKEGELARVERERIEIREPIQFRVDTAELLPESRPTLEAVSEVLNENPHIRLVLIEGHASSEGSHPYNYALSNRRAHAIYQALVEAGVPPDRLACRGLGETRPRAEGTDEAALAVNRRVVFHIAKRGDPVEPAEPVETTGGSEEGAEVPGAEDQSPK